MTSASLLALRKVKDWLVSGGEYRVGLPPGSLDDLKDAVLVFGPQLQLLDDQLIKVRGRWQGLDATGGDSPSTVQAFVIEICQLDVFSRAVIGQAAYVRVKADEALNLVRLALQDYPGKVTEAENQLTAAKRDRDQAFRDLDAAKAELEGDKGFWNGVLTGLTFTAYNPLQDNINKANDAIARINNSFGVIQNRINALNQTTAELHESERLLADLYALDLGLTDYENDLNSVQMTVGQACADEAKYAGAHSAGVASYYRQRAGKEMDSLLGWIGVFDPR